MKNWPEILDKVSLGLFVLAISLVVLYIVAPLIFTPLYEFGLVHGPSTNYECIEVVVTATENTTETDLKDLTEWFEKREAKLTGSNSDSRLYMYQLRQDDDLEEVLKALNADGTWMASRKEGLSTCFPELEEGNGPFLPLIILLLGVLALISKATSWYLKKR